MTMPDPDLHVPPSEIELAQLLDDVSAALGPSAALVLRRLACERDRLRMTLEGERKARELLLKGMESQAELMDDLKQKVRRANP